MDVSNLAHAPTEALSAFVAYHTQGRDPSHDWEHMAQVADLSLALCHKLPSSKQALVSIPQLLAVAWLHDVSDHKYDSSGILRNEITRFLTEQYLPPVILDIIDAISFSNEKALIATNTYHNEHRDVWLHKFGEGGLLIRDLVSDADKLQALGRVGYERCVQYTRHVYPDCTTQYIAEKVYQHYHEKLSVLADQYMLTDSGRLKGREATEELFCLVMSGLEAK